MLDRPLEELLSEPTPYVIDTLKRSKGDFIILGVGGKMGPTLAKMIKRGLTTAGTWSATSGTYADAGGYIAFAGGAVNFYPNLGTATTSPLLSNNPSSTSQSRPIDIRQAIPLNGTAVGTNSARIYGIAPTTGAGGMIGTAAGAQAARGQ